MDAQTKPLVLFDGVCNFCNDSVLFVVDRDPSERFTFASLQSDAGQATLQAHGCKPELETIVLVADGRVHLRSAAALRIAKGLKWPWPLLFYLCIWIPRPVRDLAYRYVAARRYQWFGQSEQCRIPTPELRRRMLA